MLWLVANYSGTHTLDRVVSSILEREPCDAVEKAYPLSLSLYHYVGRILVDARTSWQLADPILGERREATHLKFHS